MMTANTILIITNGNNVIVKNNGVKVNDPERVVANLAERSHEHRKMYNEILAKMRKS